MAQRALSHSWVSPLPQTTDSDLFSVSQTMNASQFGSENNISCTTESGSSVQFSCNSGFQHQTNAFSYPLDVMTSYSKANPMNFKYPLPVSSADIPTSFMFSPRDMPMASMLLNLSPPSLLGDFEKYSPSIDFGQPQQCNSLAVDLPTDLNGRLVNEEEEKSNLNTTTVGNNQCGTMRTVSFPFNLSPVISDDWKLNLPWDSPPCPSELSTSFSTNKCYT